MYSKEERQDIITEKIISSVYMNHLKNGDRMPSENQLSNTLNVSRAAVRQVYDALELIGIVESRRGEGTFLKVGMGADNMILRLMMLTIYNDQSDVSEIMEIRKIIEIGIAERAAQYRTDADVRLLRKIVKEMQKCTDGNRLSELDNELHSAINNSCGNTLMCSLSGIISSLVISSIREHWNYILYDSRMDTRQKTFEQHRELVDAIINRKPNVARLLMQEHLDFVSMSLDRYKKEFASYEADIQRQARIAELSRENQNRANSHNREV